MPSETQKYREYLVDLLKGKNGVDLGFGGDAVCETSINIDMPRPYTCVGTSPQHLAGDARNLEWFRDGVLDYVYSSHLLEDFPNTEEILTEWTRVLGTGGYMILNLPHEQKYRAHCKARGEGRNTCHSIEDMSPEYMWPIMERVGLERISEVSTDAYSFLLVARKI